MHAEYSECQRQGVATAAPSYKKNTPNPHSSLLPHIVDGPVDKG